MSLYLKLEDPSLLH